MSNDITVMSLNCLHPDYAIRWIQREGLICDDAGNPALENGQMQSNWPTRHKVIGANISKVNPDILPLQEISKQSFDNLASILTPLGYRGEHSPHAQGDGVAVFWNASKFKLLQTYINRHNGDNRSHLIVDLEDNARKVIRVASGHFRGDKHRDHLDGSGHAALVVQDMGIHDPNSTYDINMYVFGGDLNAYSDTNPKIKAFTNNGYHSDGSTAGTNVDPGILQANPQTPQIANVRYDWIFVKNKDKSKPRLQFVDPKSLGLAECSDHLPAITRIAMPAIAAANPPAQAAQQQQAQAAPATPAQQAQRPAPRAPANPPMSPKPPTPPSSGRKTTINVLETVINAYAAKNCIFEAPDATGKMVQEEDVSNLNLSQSVRVARWVNKDARCLDTINKQLAAVKVTGQNLQERIRQTTYLLENMKVFNKLADEHLSKGWVRIYRFFAALFSFGCRSSIYACKTLHKEIKQLENDLTNLRDEVVRKKSAVPNLLKNDMSIFLDLMEYPLLKEGLDCHMGQVRLQAPQDINYVLFAENRIFDLAPEQSEVGGLLFKYIEDMGLAMWQGLGNQIFGNVSVTYQAHNTRQNAVEKLPEEQQKFLKKYIQLLNSTFKEYTKQVAQARAQGDLDAMLAQIPQTAKLGLTDAQLKFFMTNYKTIFEPSFWQRIFWT